MITGTTSSIDRSIRFAGQAGQASPPGQVAAGLGSEPADASFAALLRGVLGDPAAETISEEELFAGLIEHRLAEHAGSEAAESYHALLAERLAANTRPDGLVLFEKAATEALAALEADGTISADQAARVKEEAFQAAQLDNDSATLYDRFGGGSDPTVAVMGFEAAMFAARTALQRIDAGQAPEGGAGAAAGTPAVGGSGTAAAGNTSDGAKAGFTFKPVSENDGKLVVLLPATLAGKVQSTALKDAGGATIETGRSTGMANPDQVGEREHFRFSRPGGRYPANLVVDVALKDGTHIAYRIPNPSQRYD